MTVEQDQKSAQMLKWVLICAGAVTALVVDYLFHGWGRPLLLTILIFGSLVAFCRAYWGTAFWMSAIVTFALHVALMVRFRTTINAVTMPVLFGCAVAEIIAIAVVLTIAVPDRVKRRGTR